VGLLDDMGINPSGAEIIFDKTLKFFPLSPSNGYSNVDASVDKCEALLVTPNFYLASGVAHSVYDTLFRLKSSLGLSSYRSIDLLSASSTSSAKTLKLFGFILPGEDTFEAITSNRFYDDHQGSHLTSTSLSPENPSALGWAARAPAVLYPNDRSNTGRGAITYEMSFRPFELLNAPNSVYSVLNITQSVYVSGTANFCSKN
jgi:hypothetical protein